MAYVQIRNLAKAFGATRALHGISLDVDEREFVSILGPSGCGKTTTLRIVLGLLHPDAGSVHVRDRDMTAVSPRERRIGMVFQNYALWPHMTVYENIAFGLRVQRVEGVELERRVLDLIDRLQMQGLAQRKPGELSGGQQQRVALARALIVQPPLLLLDEPLSNLDRKLREDMRLELKQVQKSFRQTMVYVTHDQEEALSLSDRVVVMNAGRIEQIDTPHEVYHRPTTSFVARFIGKSSLVPVTIEALDPHGTTTLLLADGTRLDVQRVRRGEHFRAGQHAMLVIRPEEVTATSPDEPAGNAAVNARIGEHLFLGQTLRYQLTMADGTEIFADSRQPLVGDDNGWLRLRVKGGCLVAA